ncbi:ketose-bisphosphate aldolase, partial [Mycoplasmoides pneumoniae]
SGHQVVVPMVKGLVDALKITVPVALHLDHGSYEGCKAALQAGFSSIMFDGSHLPFQENFTKSKELIELAKQTNASVELEVGTLGGEEDGIVGQGELANIEECKQIATLKPDALAAGIGNIHGLYPDNWKGLNYELIEAIAKATNLPLVLHGGSGIPEADVKKAIGLGISKLNINTECQLAFAKAIREYVEAKKDLDTHNKGYDPRKLLKSPTQAIVDCCLEKMQLCGSTNKA